MRLRELDACFVYNASAKGHRRSPGDSVEGMQGILLKCPACSTKHRIRVFFSNPRGVAVAGPECDDNPRWAMSGTTLDDLTLSPSVDCTRDKHGNPTSCSYHGFIANGDVR